MIMNDTHLPPPDAPLPRYPDVRVRVRSRHPLVAVSAVRHALRRAGVGAVEVRRFTEEALDKAQPTPDVCRAWAQVDFDS